MGLFLLLGRLYCFSWISVRIGSSLSKWLILEISVYSSGLVFSPDYPKPLLNSEGILQSSVKSSGRCAVKLGVYYCVLVRSFSSCSSSYFLMFSSFYTDVQSNPCFKNKTAKFTKASGRNWMGLAHFVSRFVWVMWKVVRGFDNLLLLRSENFYGLLYNHTQTVTL